MSSRKLHSRVAFQLALLVGVSQLSFSCKFAMGYFHQVTCLRGKVVGQRMGPLQYVAFLRHCFRRPGAELTLDDFKEKPNTEEPRVIAKTAADQEGRFDFGPLPAGHYHLTVQSGKYFDGFDVEITSTVKQTESVLIDVSPFVPDCKGGHEFKIREKKS